MGRWMMLSSLVMRCVACSNSRLHSRNCRLRSRSFFLAEQFRKFGFPFTNKGKHSIYLHQQNLLHLYIAYLVGGAFSFLLTIGGADEMLLLVCPPSGSDLVQFRTAVGAEQHPG